MFWRSICFCHCSAYEATSHSQHSKETTGKFLSVWIFKRPFVFLVPTPINCATEDKCVCHVCLWGSHMWTSVLCYFKFHYSFSVFYIHYISGILEKKRRKVTVWNKKQNCPMFSLHSFFEAGFRRGGSVMSSKADISWWVYFLKHGVRWLLHEPQIHFLPWDFSCCFSYNDSIHRGIKKLEVSNYGKDTSPELKGVEFKYPSCHLQVAGPWIRDLDTLSLFYHLSNSLQDFQEN